jgi:hypothetical protein
MPTESASWRLEFICHLVFFDEVANTTVRNRRQVFRTCPLRKHRFVARLRACPQVIRPVAACPIPRVIRRQTMAATIVDRYGLRTSIGLA